MYVIYHYNLTQWPNVNDTAATFPSVGAEVCGGEDYPAYVVPDSGTSAIIDRVAREIITHAPPVGKLTFLVDDGTNTGGDKIDVIYEHSKIAIVYNDVTLFLFSTM